MDLLFLKIHLIIAAGIFCIGLGMMMARQAFISIVLGQIISLKACAYAAIIWLTMFPEKIKMLSILVFVGIFFCILFFIASLSLMTRDRETDHGKEG